MSEKQKLLKDSLYNTFSSIILRISQIIQGIFVANILGPVLFGLKNAIQMILDYGNYSHLGVLNSFYKERQSLEYTNVKKRDYYTNIVFSYLVLIGVISILISIVLFIFLNVSSTIKYSILLIGFLIPLSLFMTFLNTILQSKNEFKKIATLNIFQGIFILFFIIILVYYLGIVGYFLGALLGFLLCLLVFWNTINYTPKFVMNLKSILLFIRSGFSLFLFNLSYLVFYSIDRIFIISYYGELQLGFYAIGLFFANLMFFLIYTLLLPIVPKVFQNINNKTKISKIIIKPTNLAYLIIYWIVILILFLYPFILFIMPDYIQGVHFVYVLLFSVMFFPILIVNYFIGKNKELYLIGYTVFFLVLAIVLNLLVVLFKLPAIYIAYASAIVIALYGNSLNLVGYKSLLGSWKLAFKEVINYLWPLGYALVGYGLLWLLAHYWLYDIMNYYVVKVIQAILFTIWYLPILWKIEKEHRIIRLIWSGVKGKLRSDLSDIKN